MLMKRNYPNTTSHVAKKDLQVNTNISISKVSLRTVLLFAFVLFYNNITLAQVANYGFSQASGTYTVPSGLSNNSGNNWDDEINPGTIGFTFNFNGTNYTSCNVSTNGFITFGATAPASNNYNPISSNAGYEGTISALGRDLVHNGTRVRTVTTGTAPNRTFIVQWTNARRYNLAAQNGDFNFQIILHETTNVIQVVYGACTSAYAFDLTAEVGLRGASNTDFNNRATTNNWPASTAGATNTATCNTGNGAGELPTNGLTYTWTPRPTITSLVGSPACAGGNITINGTNLSNATSVTIGGTAVASITTNTSTQIVAVIGGGTTGTVQVTTAGGTAASAGSFTVNPSPAAIGGGAASVCVSATTPAFTNATGGGTWSITNGTGSATISAGGVVTGSTAGTATVVYSIGTCSSTTPITINPTISTLATATTPTNGATGVCYSGTGAVTQLSWGAAAGATGYDVYFGTTVTPTLVSSNQAATTWTISPILAANTTYYWKIVPRNGCGVTTGTAVNWSFTTTSSPCIAYCTPSSSSGTAYIAGVSSEGSLINVSNSPTTYSAGGYGNYSAITIASQIPGGGINININLVGGQIIRTFVDWNNDGVFADPAEEVYSTGTTTLSGATTYGFVVPSGQAPGNYRMRIRTRTVTPVDPCTAHPSGEAEDYTINIVADCLQKITSVANGSACGSPNTVNLSATSAGATGFRWYSAETGGSLLATTATGSWTTPSIAATTTYYVTAYNGTCESLFRTPIKATILTTTNITITPSAPVLCGDNNPITITASGDTTEEDILVQDFESGMAPFTATIPTSTNAGADSPWTVKTSPYKPSGTSVWKPAINSGSIATIGNKFALSTSDYNGSNIVTIITSPVINPSTYNSLTLTFDQYYSYFSADSGEVQVSVNGGAFASVTPTTAIYNSDLGTPSNFVTQTVNLNAYALPANTSLQFRFVYTAQFDDGWAIDNIRLSGIKPLNTAFTWSGGVDAYIDVACTIPYVAQSVSTIYVKPNATQLNSPSWSFTATATLSNGCTAVKNINVTNNTKTWTGASSQLWSDASNWAPNGVPTSSNCVVIPNTTQITGSGYNAFAKNVTVKSTGNLELQSSNNLTVTDEITVNTSGVFNIRNNASLVQTNNVANTGIVNAQRTANIRQQDYVYWAAPVANFPVGSISPGTSGGYIYKWLPTNTTSYASNFGTWAGTSENMVTGKGYIVRGPNAYSQSAAANYTATFRGVPNNGTITTPISRSTYNGASYAGPTTTLVTANDDNWNLVGNPYPSSIRAIDFLNANTNIAGFINLWTHGTLPVSSVDPFYANYTYNYTVADYITYNASGASSGPGVFNGYIGSGQGFFVLMNHTSAATTENVTFNNSMRSAAYSNSQFYRSTDNSQNSSEPEHNRIWLDIIKTADNSNRRTLIGYIEGATDEKDRLYDAVGSEKLNFNIYSLINNEMQLIQGKALPFDINDTVDIGINIAQNGEYRIGIGALDGLFSESNQDILIEDKLLNIVHNIKASPYTFTANQGRDNNRFVLKFVNQTLSDDDNVYANDIKIFSTNTLNIESTKLSINNITVYDIVGKKLLEMNDIQQKQVIINQLKPTTNVLLVKVTLDNGTVITKKVVY